MSFFNPYMKGIDVGGGVSDMANKAMQMMMMKQMFGQRGGSKVAPETPAPNPNIQYLLNDPRFKQMLMQMRMR